MQADAPDPNNSALSPERSAAEGALRWEALGRVAAGAAHDMNNVLGVILGYVELARMQLGSDPEKADAHLQTALLTVERVRQITDGMLDLREEPLAPDLGSLDEAAAQATVLIRAAADPRVEVDLALGDAVPVPPLDAPALRHLVLGLGLHALAGMPEGGALGFSTHVEELGESLSVGSVTLCPGIYACLVVADRTTPEAPGEAGSEAGQSEDVRMRMARELAERHGGSLTSERVPAGNRVLVRLPSALRVPPVASAAERPPASEPSVDILVVDDEAPVRDVLRGFLEIDGYRVAEAATGAEALAKLQGEAAGTRLVFLDHLLTDVRGAQLAWRLAELPEAPTVVMITGMADPDGLAALPPGTRILPKPFLYRELKALLQDELQFSPRPPSS